MKYILMMNTPGNGPYQIASWPAQDLKAHIEFMMGFGKKLSESGELVGAEGLAGPDQAKLVRAGQDGTPITCPAGSPPGRAGRAPDGEPGSQSPTWRQRRSRCAQPGRPASRRPRSRESIAPALGAPRIPIYPRSLGRQLRGGLWPGHHLTVFARPEIGKSAFAINTAVMAASRGKARVLYLSNEDSVRDLMLRAPVRFTGRAQEDVLTHLEECIETARRMGADRLMFRDMAPGSLAEIDRLVRRYKPDLLIVDQMRNIGTTGKNADNMTQRLDAVAQGLRNIGKRHGCAVYQRYAGGRLGP